LTLAVEMQTALEKRGKPLKEGRKPGSERASLEKEKILKRPKEKTQSIRRPYVVARRRKSA